MEGPWGETQGGRPSGVARAKGIVRSRGSNDPTGANVIRRAWCSAQYELRCAAVQRLGSGGRRDAALSEHLQAGKLHSIHTTMHRDQEVEPAVGKKCTDARQHWGDARSAVAAAPSTARCSAHRFVNPNDRARLSLPNSEQRGVRPCSVANSENSERSQLSFRRRHCPSQSRSRVPASAAVLGRRGAHVPRRTAPGLEALRPLQRCETAAR